MSVNRHTFGRNNNVLRVPLIGSLARRRSSRQHRRRQSVVRPQADAGLCCCTDHGCDASLCRCAGWRAGGVETLATSFAADVELLEPGMEPLRGPQAIRAFLAPLAAQVTPSGMPRWSPTRSRFTEASDINGGTAGKL